MHNNHDTDTHDLKLAHILVVDDDHSSARLIELALNTVGYNNISTTLEPRNVLDLYNDHQCDLLILDLNMPEMNGFDIMHQLKQNYGNKIPPILVLTGQDEQDIRIRALQNGARDYLTKPFLNEELIARASNLLEMHCQQKNIQHYNEQLEKKVKERTVELRSTRLEIVQRLGHAAEYRDNETGMHIIRMSKVSEMLGNAIGLNEHASDLLLNASPMHDIGKIGIPDNILLKPGKLDQQEWTTMKTHTTIGATILSGSNSDLLEMARVIALTHHEKWDGSGYPKEMAGDDIPLVGRIVALADVFDALVSERPYKKAWPVEAALEYINEQSGKHFDPDLVKAFSGIIPQILDISEKYSDSLGEVTTDPLDDNLSASTGGS